MKNFKIFPCGFMSFADVFVNNRSSCNTSILFNPRVDHWTEFGPGDHCENIPRLTGITMFSNYLFPLLMGSDDTFGKLI